MYIGTGTEPVGFRELECFARARVCVLYLFGGVVGLYGSVYLLGIPACLRVQGSHRVLRLSA